MKFITHSNSELAFNYDSDYI